MSITLKFITIYDETHAKDIGLGDNVSWFVDDTLSGMFDVEPETRLHDTELKDQDGIIIAYNQNFSLRPGLNTLTLTLTDYSTTIQYETTIHLTIGSSNTNLIELKFNNKTIHYSESQSKYIIVGRLEPYGTVNYVTEIDGATGQFSPPGAEDITEGLKFNEIKELTLEITAEDGITTKNYIIQIIRTMFDEDLNLNSITISNGYSNLTYSHPDHTLSRPPYDSYNNTQPTSVHVPTYGQPIYHRDSSLSIQFTRIFPEYGVRYAFDEPSMKVTCDDYEHTLEDGTIVIGFGGTHSSERIVKCEFIYENEILNTYTIRLIQVQMSIGGHELTLATNTNELDNVKVTSKILTINYNVSFVIDNNGENDPYSNGEDLDLDIGWNHLRISNAELIDHTVRVLYEPWELISVSANSSLEECVQTKYKSEDRNRILKNAYAHYGGNSIARFSDAFEWESYSTNSSTSVRVDWEHFVKSLYKYPEPTYEGWGNNAQYHMFDLMSYQKCRTNVEWPCWVQLTTIDASSNSIFYPDIHIEKDIKASPFRSWFQSPGWYVVTDDVYNSLLVTDELDFTSYEHSESIEGDIYWVYIYEAQCIDPRQWFMNSTKDLLYNDYKPGTIQGVTTPGTHYESPHSFVNNVQIVMNGTHNSFDIQDSNCGNFFLSTPHDEDFTHDDFLVLNAQFPERVINTITGPQVLNFPIELGFKFKLIQDSSHKHLYSIEAIGKGMYLGFKNWYTYVDGIVSGFVSGLRLSNNWPSYFLLDSIVFPGEFYLKKGESMFKYAWQGSTESYDVLVVDHNSFINVDGNSLHVNSIIIDKVYRDNYFTAGYDNGEYVQPLYVYYYDNDYKLTKDEQQGKSNYATFTYEPHSPNSWTYTLMWCIGPNSSTWLPVTINETLCPSDNSVVYYSYWDGLSSYQNTANLLGQLGEITKAEIHTGGKIEFTTSTTGTIVMIGDKVDTSNSLYIIEIKNKANTIEITLTDAFRALHD